MMVNGGSAAVQLTCIQCYGGASGGEGNFSLWAPEWDAPVGVPLGEPSNATGFWVRSYTRGLALVNAAATAAAYTLPPGTWSDVDGGAVPGPAVELGPASGLVLVAT